MLSFSEFQSTVIKCIADGKMCLALGSILVLRLSSQTEEFWSQR